MDKLKLFLIFGLVMAGLVFAATLLNSATTCSGAWTNCANANADGGSAATASVSGSGTKAGTWGNYGFSLPSDAIIDSVKVRSDFWSNNVRGRLAVRVSWDGGTTWSSTSTFGPATVQTTFIKDVTSATSWTPTKLSNGNLVVEATCKRSVNGTGSSTCNLDWVPVEVVYHQPMDFSVSANPSSDSVNPGGTASTTVTVTLVSGTAQTVSLTQTGCPSGAVCSFSPSSGTPTYTSTFSVQTFANTSTGTYPITIKGTGAGVVRTTVYTLAVEAS